MPTALVPGLPTVLPEAAEGRGLTPAPLNGRSADCEHGHSLSQSVHSPGGDASMVSHM